MQRLTKYEILVLFSSVLLVIVAFVGYFNNISLLFDIPVLLLMLVIILSIIMVIVRIDRLASGQKRAREEIYQVLYTLHGNDKLTENQAGKTRDLIRRNHQSLLKEIKQEAVGSTTMEKAVQLSLENEEIARLEENERLRFNKLIGILDAQWSLLENLRQPNGRDG